MKEALRILAQGFDVAADEGRPRTLWWRDDDAVRPGPRLDALAAIAADHGAPLALAVIPASVEPGFPDHCAERGWAVLQHGFAHVDHEPAGKPAELGDARPAQTILAECLSVRDALTCASALPVMVPPWNRMRADLPKLLAREGYRGISLFGTDELDGPPRRVDTHIDPFEWRRTRDLLPNDALAAMAHRAIATRGPIGLLTHHAVHTPSIDRFVTEVAALVARHAGARFVSAREAFSL